MLNLLYDLQPTHMTSDYYAAALELMRRVRKRALVVILSNLRDEDEDTLTPALRLLGQRHLVLFASLRESILTLAIISQARALSTVFSKSLAKRRLRLSHAIVRSTTHRRGNSSNPLAASERRTISMCRFVCMNCFSRVGV